MIRKANKRSKEQGIARVQAEPFSRTSISFYKYANIVDPELFRNTLYDEWEALGVLGRVYVAKEGINAQLSVPAHSMETFRAMVDAHKELTGVPFKIGVEEAGISFWKLTIKSKRFILADGLPDNEYDVTDVGTHLTAKEFNDAIEDGAVVVDMRNNYESDIGHFEGAICPDVTTFREELPVVLGELKGKEEEKVLLYCTGGIRCEKASAYLKHHGFKDVNQLHGGIIDYKHQIEREGLESKYKGANFVFDGRAPEQITDDVLGTCYQCKGTANTPTNCTNQACHVLFIQCEPCSNEMNGACSLDCKTLSLKPKEEQRKHARTLQGGYKIVAR